MIYLKRKDSFLNQWLEWRVYKRNSKLDSWWNFPFDALINAPVITKATLYWCNSDLPCNDSKNIDLALNDQDWSYFSTSPLQDCAFLNVPILLHPQREFL